VLPLHGNAHRVVDAMLPWYVNGTLDDDERVMVQCHLDECVQCRDEVEWLRELHAACVACADQDSASQGFGGLRRKLGGRVDETPAPRRGFWAALPPVWRTVAVAQLAMIVALGAMVVNRSDDAARYRTLGNGVATAADGNVVVVFDGTTTEAQMRTLLRSVGARVVDGPTQSNAYVLAIAPEEQTHALKVLHASRGVTLAQPLVAAEAR
jgi:anti-sigma-K factor RskA